MAFYCKCGHTRGNHDNPNKDAYKVGKCNVVVAKIEGGSITCGCPKYHGDRKLNQRDYADIYVYKIGILGLLSALSTIGLTQLDNSIATGILEIEIFVGMFISLYFWIMKPYEERFEKEKLEK